MKSEYEKDQHYAEKPRSYQEIEDFYYQTMNIKGGWRKPVVTDLLMVKTVLLPWWLLQTVLWHVKWIVFYKVLGSEYSLADQAYLTRINLEFSERQWDHCEDEDKEDWISRKIWIKSNFEEFDKE